MWYYSVDGQTLGPLNEAELDSRVQTGALAPTVYVWREGMANWLPYNEARPAPAASSPPALRVSLAHAAAAPAAETAETAYEPQLTETLSGPQGGTRFESASSWVTVVVVVVAMFFFIGMLAGRTPSQDPSARRTGIETPEDGTTFRARIRLRSGSLAIDNQSGFDWPATTITFESDGKQFVHKLDGLAKRGSISVPLRNFSASGGENYVGGFTKTEPRDFVLNIKGHGTTKVHLTKR
jgi:hypothetical protein